MNSIIPTPVAASARGELPLDAALFRLGAWLDAEMAALEGLLDVSGRGDAHDDLVALWGMHLDPACTPMDTRRLLEDAHASLARLLERVRNVSSDYVSDARAPADFDAWLRWSGARLQEIVDTLSRSLDS